MGTADANDRPRLREQSDLRDELVARLALAAVDAAGGHLDENDLALLEIDALSQSEARAVRKHVGVCDDCRQKVVDVLRSGAVDEPATQTSTW